jgi:pimeloyl-CoA synthetase
LNFSHFEIGELTDEKAVLEWIVTQKNDESIEDVDRETFLEYIDLKDFLAVVFCNLSQMIDLFSFKFQISYRSISDDEEDEKTTTRVLRHFELIDDEAAEYGIKIVKASDDLMAKKFGYRQRPGLTYFRKGRNCL